MIQFSSFLQAKKFISNGKFKFCLNWNRFLSSSSSSNSSNNGGDFHTDHQSTHENIKKSSLIKFQNVLNYLEKSIPLFIDNDDNNEYKEFNNAINRLRSNLESIPEFNNQQLLLDRFDDELIKIELKKFLSDRFLYSRSSILMDGSISCLIYPDLGLWNKILSEKFLIDFIVANILGAIDYLDNVENLQYSRIPSLGHDYIDYHHHHHHHHQQQQQQNDKKSNFITITFGCNYYLIDMEQFDNRYQALWQILKFLFNSSSSSKLSLTTTKSNSYPLGVLSTLPRNDCMYGYKFLNELDIQKIRQSKLIISIESMNYNLFQSKNDNHQSNINNIERDHRISLMAKQILLSNEENIGNRWYDKSIQMIFVLNKNLDQLYSHGICFEQSHAKIESILQLMDHSIKFLTKFKPKFEIDSTKTQRDIQFKKLQIFDTKSKKLTEIINQATNHFAMEKYLNISSSNKYFQLSMLQFNDYGLDLLENKYHLSAEDWIQISFNLTIYNLTGGNIRPCYQRYLPNGYNNGNMEQWFQCLNQELLDYFQDNNDRKKLLLALESLKYHREILMPNIDTINNLESILLVYQNLTKFSFGNDLNKLYPELINNMENLFKLKSMKRLRRSTIQITTLKPAKNYYDWHLVTNGNPYYDHRINLTAHLASNQIHFTLTMLRCGNDQQLRTISVDKILYELDQSLKKLKNVFQT